MKQTKWLLSLALLCTTLAFNCSAETFALKTNALGWATTTPNIGAEMAVSDRVTLQVFGALNPWNFKGDTKEQDKHVKFWSVQPEVRYWLCQSFNGHFVGFHLLGGEYNVKNVNLPLGMLPKNDVEGRHYEGWYAGAGFTYGYQWMLSRNWNLEASIGLGYAYSPWKLYGRCERVLDKQTKHYVGPTKVAVSLMYIF